MLFAGAAFALRDGHVRPHPTDPLPFALPLVLGSIGLALTIVAGYFGWELVQKHHVGLVDERPRTS